MTQPKKSQRLEPVSVTDTAWLYAEKKGMVVVQEHRDADGSYVGTAQVLIPWALIRAATPQSK